MNEIDHYWKDLKQKPFVRYGFAVLMIYCAVVLVRLLSPRLGNEPFDFFQGAVVLSAWFGGFGPGMLSVCLSILSVDYLFIEPRDSLSYEMADVLRLSIFGSVAFLTSTINGKLQQAKFELELSKQDLERRIDERTQELSAANDSLLKEITQRVEAEKAITETSQREQKRLGQDLHDSLCQILAGLRLISGGLGERLRAQNLTESKDADLIEQQLGVALEQADVISRGLFPVELETNGLEAALDELCRKVLKLYGVKSDIKMKQRISITDVTVATHIYRIAQEAVMNAIKSGKAKQVRVRLSESAHHFRLQVADNGIGMRAEKARKGMGLKIMEYRARVIHGRIKFQSRIGRGTVVTCTFPKPTGGEL